MLTLSGRVRTSDGQTFTSGVMVTLGTGRGGIIATIPTDAHGEFQFEGLAPDLYELTVTGDGIQTNHQTVDLSFGAPSFNMVDIYVSAAAHHQILVSDLPALTDEAAPKAARKEFSQGIAALKKQDLKKARHHLEEAVREYSCYARAQTALAQVDAAEHRFDQAESALQKAIQCDGTYLDSFALLGQLYTSEKKFEQSEAVLQQGLRLAPSSWGLRYQMGRAHFELGKYQEAARDFEEAAASHPDMPADFHAQLANTYIEMGEFDKALAEIDTYLYLDPYGRFAASARRTSQAFRSRGITPATTRASVLPASKP